MKKIKMHKVISDMIASIGYDKDDESLYMEFHNGQVYEYYDVPENVFNNLKETKSPGTYFYKAIRSEFEFTRINSHVTDGILQPS